MDFLGDLKTPKGHFEIIWLLDKMSKIIQCKYAKFLSNSGDLMKNLDVMHLQLQAWVQFQNSSQQLLTKILFAVKVQLFWEGHKNLRHPLYGFDGLLKYGFCNKVVIAIVFSNHAQKWGQICCKSVQLVRVSSFRNDLLQNSDFSWVDFCQKNHVVSLSSWKKVWYYLTRPTRLFLYQDLIWSKVLFIAHKFSCLLFYTLWKYFQCIVDRQKSEDSFLIFKYKCNYLYRMRAIISHSLYIS